MTKWLSMREAQVGAMKDITIISKAIADYVSDNGVMPKQDGIYDENSEFYKSLTPFYSLTLPVKDPWGNNYLVYCGKACNGKYGFTNTDSDDFIVASYGKDGKKDKWEFDPNNPELGIAVMNTPDDFNKDLVIWNGYWIRAPRARDV